MATRVARTSDGRHRRVAAVVVRDFPAEYFDDLEELSSLQSKVLRGVRQGSTVEEAARVAGVPFATVRLWLRNPDEFPDFGHALERVLINVDAQLIRALREREADRQRQRLAALDAARRANEARRSPEREQKMLEALKAARAGEKLEFVIAQYGIPRSSFFWRLKKERGPRPSR